MANTVAKLVFIPAPGVGHIMSTIQIAKLLVTRDQNLSVTILVMKSFSSGSGSDTTTESLAKNTTNRISFIELPREETPPVRESKSHLTMFSEFIDSHCKHVRNIVSDMISQPSSCQVAGFVIDMFCTSMIDVANEFNVPTYLFFTSNAAFLGFYLYVQILCDDKNQDVLELIKLDTEISLPSYVKPVPMKVLWPIVQTKEGLDFVLQSARKLREVKAIMVNTFLELETHAIGSFSSDVSIPTVFPVGPILNLEGCVRKAFDDDVISWLDGQPPSSVVFLCFGSMGSFDDVQVKEIAYALERSGHRFVWSLRQPPSDQNSKASIVPGVYEDLEAVLPKGFLERTAGIGKVIGWAPQVTLLAHRAVGGFVSHCGWNSLLESLWFGVPVATWPMYAEQQMNAFEMVVELELAVEIKLDYKCGLYSPNTDIVIVTAKGIESGIRRVMEDNEVRAKVKETSEKSRAAEAEGGSSYAAVDYLVQDFKRNIF